MRDAVETRRALVDAVATLPLPILWSGAALLVFSLSAAPGAVWADSSKLAFYALHSYLPSLNPGDHAGWTVLARIWLWVIPWIDPVRSLHLLSACAGAAVVGLAAAVALRRSGDPVVGHTTAALVLVAHSVWWSSAITESYAPAAALGLAASWLAMHRNRSLAAVAGVVAGLAVTTHLFAAVLAFPALLWSRRRWSWTVVGAMLGAAPCWLAILASPVDPLTGHQAAGIGSLSWSLSSFVEPRRLVVGAVMVVALLGLNLGPIGLLAVLRSRIGGHAWAGGERWLQTLAVLGLGLLLTVYAPYRLHTMVVFLVLALVLLRPPVLTRRLRAAHLVVQTTLYLGLAVLAHGVARADLGVRQLPYRDNAAYFLCPVKTIDRGAQRYAEELLAAVPERAVILADFNPGVVLRLLQEQRDLRPDVTVQPSVVDDALATADPAAALADRIRSAEGSGRPVVLADEWQPYYRIGELETRFGASVQPVGPGWQVQLPPAPHARLR